MSTQFVLIRHGITEWNKKGRYCGCKDVTLNSQGRAQARKLRRIAKAFVFDRVYSSNRKRAMQTARIMFNGTRIIKVRALREINFGRLEGLSHKEIMKRIPEEYRKWLKDPFENRIPKAEPVKIFKNRVKSIMRKIACLNDGNTVAIVCHGGVIGMFVSSILKNRNFWRYVPSSASITVVEYKKDIPRIKLFNDTAHLS